MYEYIDKNIKKHQEQNKKILNNLRLNLMKYDELNVMSTRKEVKKTFKKLRDRDIQFFYMLIDYLATQYKSGSLLLKEFLDSYNGTLLYVYSNEIERKEQRYLESLIALSKRDSKIEEPEKDNKSDIRKKNESQMSDMPKPKMRPQFRMWNENVFNTVEALRNQTSNANNWNRQLEEISVDLERKYILNDMKERGISKVMWITQRDERVCPYCESLDGLIFEIDRLPARPHINCRCTFKEVADE